VLFDDTTLNDVEVSAWAITSSRPTSARAGWAVYRALDTKCDRDVAIKVLLPAVVNVGRLARTAGKRSPCVRI
jgi:hypothetical protein